MLMYDVSAVYFAACASLEFNWHLIHLGESPLKVKFAAWATFAQRNQSELSHMAGAVDDININIVVVIITFYPR